MIPDGSKLVIPKMTNVSISPISRFENGNVQFIFAKVDEPFKDYEYIMTASTAGGVGRVTLGGTKEQLLRFFEKGMEALQK
jgi:hypothetical protein